MERPEVLELGPGRSAPAVSLEREDEASAAVELLGLEGPRPTLVVVGGAGGLDDARLAPLVPYAEALVRAATSTGATIVDGGTDVGVMRLVGRAHAAAGSGLPLVGVVVSSLASRPGEPVVPPAAALEPHHTHFVLVAGSSWGDEAPWLARIAGVLAGPAPSTTVLVNGGEIAWTDVAESLAAGRRVLAVAGTGRTADALVAGGDPRAETFVRTGLVEAVSLGQDGRPSLEERVREILGSRRPADGR